MIFIQIIIYISIYYGKLSYDIRIFTSNFFFYLKKLILGDIKFNKIIFR